MRLFKEKGYGNYSTAKHQTTIHIKDNKCGIMLMIQVVPDK